MSDNELMRHPFAHVDWARSWLESYELEKSERVVYLEQAGGKILYPLMVDGAGLRSLCTSAADVTGGIYENAGPELIEALAGELGSISRNRQITFWNVERDDLLVNAMCSKHPSNLIDETLCHVVRIDEISSSVKEWIAASTTRKQAFRDLRRLRKNGVELTFRARPSESELVELMNLHNALWRSRGLPGKFEDRRKRKFLLSLWRRNYPICISAMRVDGRIVAYNLFFQLKGRLYFWNSGFDVSYKKWGPGTALILADILSLAESAQGLVFDFLRGDEAYKRAFATDSYFVETRIVEL